MLADQLSSELRTRVTANGRTIDEWRAKPAQDNHFLDCLVGCHVAASVRGAKLDESAAIIRSDPGGTVAHASIAAAVERVTTPAGQAPSCGGWLDGGSSGGGWL